MKKLNRKSVAVAGLALALSAGALTGCNADELLDAKIIENASQVESVAQNASAELEKAKRALEDQINSGDSANAGELAQAILDLQDAIDEAKTYGHTDLDQKIEDAEKTAQAATDELEKRLTGLEQDLTAKYTTMKTLHNGSLTSIKELTQAVSTLTSDLKEAKKVAEDGDKTTLQDAIDAADKAATEAINTLKDELTEADGKLREDLDKLQGDLDVLEGQDLDNRATQLKADIEAIQAELPTIKNTADQNKTELQNAIDDLESKLEEASATAAETYIKLADWNANTDVAVEYVIKLEKAYNAVSINLIEDAKVMDALNTAHIEGYVRIVRSLTKEDAEKALTDATSLFDGIQTIVERYKLYESKKELYNEEGRGELKSHYENALEATAGLTQSDKTIDELAEQLDSDLKTVLTIEQIKRAERCQAEMTKLAEALEASGDTAYNKGNKQAYEALMAEIDQWYADNAGSQDKIGQETVEALKARYEAAKKQYEDDAQALQDELDAFGTGYTFLYSEEEYDKVINLQAKAEAWKAQQETGRGFTGEEEDAHGVYAAIGRFEAGAYARAEALKKADDEATTIEGSIRALTDEINAMSTIDPAYQSRYNEIVKNVETWNTTYFSGIYAGEKGSTNYSLLDHEAYEALVKLYAEKIQEKINKIKDISDMLMAVGTPEDITLYSWDALEAIQVPYATFQKDFEGMIDDLSMVEGCPFKTGTELFGYNSTLMGKYLECAKLAYDAYSQLTVLTKERVTVYTKTEIDALVAWYRDYLKLDITSPDTEYPTENEKSKTFWLSDSCTIDETTFNAAREAYQAFQTLTQAKAAKLAELTQSIAKVQNAEKKNTALRADLDAANRLYNEFISGSYAPEGFEASQITGTDNELVEGQKDALNSAEADVKALEDELAQIKDKIDALDLTTETGREAAMDALPGLKKEIDDFVTHNGGEDSCVQEYRVKLDKLTLEIKKQERKDAAKAAYDEALTLIDTISDEASDMKTDLRRRAEESLAAVNEAIDDIESEDEEPLEQHKFDFVMAVVKTCAENENNLSPAKLNANYKTADGFWDSMSKAQSKGELDTIMVNIKASINNINTNSNPES